MREINILAGTILFVSSLLMLTALDRDRAGMTGELPG